jgi:O-antigen/teichoic acid export membrane protein
MRSLGKKYYDFPLFSAPQNLMNSVSQGIPVLLLGYYYNIEVAGFYSFGVRLVNAPVGLLSAPMWQVLFQKFCEVKNQGLKILPVYRKTTLGMVAIVVLPVAVGILFFPRIFAFIFGENWRQAGEYARWLLMWHALLLCNVPSVLASRILRMQRQMLIFDFVALCLRGTVYDYRWFIFKC